MNSTLDWIKLEIVYSGTLKTNYDIAWLVLAWTNDLKIYKKKGKMFGCLHINWYLCFKFISYYIVLCI